MVNWFIESPCMLNVEQAAKESLLKYYATKKYPHQPKIDIDNIRVQVENFEWSTAAYRIDLFFLHQRPSFIPYHQNFWMAHQLFMKKDGVVIKHEQVYTSWAVHSDPELRDEKKSKHELVGFFPGNYYFKKELDFIDQVLRSKKTVIKGKTGIFFTPEIQLEFKNGIADLEKSEASIVQQADGYTIHLEAEKYHNKEQTLIGLHMHNMQFKIFNNQDISQVTTYQRPMYGLC